MIIRPFFIGLVIGAISVAIVAVFALYGNDLKWQRVACDHYAAIYYRDSIRERDVHWMWLDDYFRTKLLPKIKEDAHATPSPEPAFKEI